MDKKQEPESGKREDFRQVRSANGALAFRILAVGLVLYWLYGLISAYCKGGPDVPSLTLLIVGIVLLGGGAILVAVLTWKAWKIDRAAAEMSEEEVQEMEALREDGEDETE